MAAIAVMCAAGDGVQLSGATDPWCNVTPTCRGRWKDHSGETRGSICLMDAAEDDPLSPEPWWLIAESEYARLLKNPRQEDWTKRFVRADSKVLDLRPYSSAAWRQTGRWYYELYVSESGTRHGESCASVFRPCGRAVPQLAELRGEYALALGATGDRGEAKLNWTRPAA